MRRIILVALHEFTETIRSKTFLLGLVITPILFGLGFFLPSLLSRSFTPERAVAVVDQSQAYGARLIAEVDRALALEDMRTISQQVHAYARPEFRRDGALDPEKVPLEFYKIGSLTLADAETYLDAGGRDAALERARAYLRPEAPEPVFDPRPLRFVDLPADIDPDASPDRIAEAARAYLDKEQRIDVDGEPTELYALVILPRRFGPASHDSLAIVGEGDPDEVAQLWAEKAPSEDVRDPIKQALDRLVRRDRLGLSDGQGLQQLSTAAPFDVRLTSRDDGGSATATDAIAANMPRILSIALVFFLIGNLVILMTNTMEEKSNRIIEVLMSSISANELLAGKLFGAFLIALFQLAFNVIALLGVMSLADDGAIAQFTRSLIEVLTGSPLLLWLLFYFVTGYFLYAGLFVAIGSLCENTKEVQSLSLPVQYLLIFSPLIVWVVANEPNGPAARALSYFPLTSPMMMMARINSDPRLVDLIGTALAQIAGIALLLWLSAKVFKVGALRAGKPPKVKELVAAVRGQA